MEHNLGTKTPISNIKSQQTRTKESLTEAGENAAATYQEGE